MSHYPAGFVFVDATLADLDSVLSQIGAGHSVHIIPQGSDGLSFIASVLAGAADVGAVHILSHGTAGALVLGDMTLTADVIEDRATDLATIRGALSADADILIYGCNVAEGDAGAAFVAALSAATGADIAASEDLTGLGGDWDLEVATGAIEAVTLSLAEFNQTLLTTAYTENAAGVLIDPAITLAPAAAGDVYSGGYLLIEGSGAAGETLGFQQSASPDFTLGAISVVGAGVYRGTGTGAEVIGSIDSTLNGQNGADLKVNFSVGFTNGSVDSGTAGSSTIDGWTTGLQRVEMGTTEIAGWTTPVDSTYPAQNFSGDVWTAGGEPTRTAQLSTYAAGYTGDLAIELDTGNLSIGQSYGVIRGPFVYSNGTVVLQQGDSVSFAWKALSGGDAFDAYGYLLNVQTGQTITLLDQTGTASNQETPWATVSQSIGAGQAGEYRFVFVAGSFDLTGGQYLGGKLMIDDVTVTQANPPGPVSDFDINLLARLATFSSTAEDFASTSVSVDYTAVPGTPGGATTSYTATNTIAITETNDAPSFSATMTLGGLLPGGAAVENDVATFAAAAFSDADAQFTPADTLAGIAISGASTAPADGTWTYSVDGGTTWVALPAVSTTAALVLDTAALLRFAPAAGFGGPATLSVHAIDSTWSGGFTTGLGAVTLDTTTATATSAFGGTAGTLQVAFESLVTPSASISYTDTPAIDDFQNQTGNASAVTNLGGVSRTFSYALDGGTDQGNGTETVETDYGTLTLNTTTGAWTFAPDDDAINALGSSDTETLSFTLKITDGTGGELSQTLNVNLTGGDDAPTLEAGAGVTFLARGAGVAVAPALELEDDGAGLLGGATVTLAQGVQDNSFGTAFETLSLPASVLAGLPAGVTASVVSNASGSVLTLTGTATVAQYQAILREITYTNANTNAVSGTRTVAFEIRDTSGTPILTDSAPVNVVWAPWFDLNGPTGAGRDHEVTFVEGGTPLSIATSDAQILDQDGNIASVTVTLTNPLDNTGGATVEYLSVSAAVLTLLATNGIVLGAHDGTLSGGALTGATTLTFVSSSVGGQPATRFQVGVRGVQYSNSSDAPDTTDRVVTVVGTDTTGNSGLGAQTIINLTAVNDAPTASPAYIIAAEDTDYTFAVADFGFSDAADGGADALAAVLIDTLPASGSLMLDGVALTGPTEVSAADIAAGKLVYRPAPGAAGTGAASFTVRVRDDSGAGDGSDISAAAATVTISLSTTNDAPVLAPNDATFAMSEDAGNTAGIRVSSLLGSALTDVDTGTHSSTNGTLEGIAVFDPTGSVGTFQFRLAGTSVWQTVTLSAGDALLLRAGDLIRLVPDGDTGGTASFSYHGWDQSTGTAGNVVSGIAGAGNAAARGGTSAFSEGTATVTFNVADAEDAPTVQASSSATFYARGEAVSVFAPGDVVLNDPDGTTILTQANVRLVSSTALDNLFGAWEALSFPDGSTIETSSGAVLRVRGTPTSLVLSGNGTLADYTEALETLQYYNGNPNMTVGARAIRITVTDATGLTSTAATVNLAAEWGTVVDLNGAAADRDHAVTYVEGSAGVAIAAADAELVDQDGNTRSVTATLQDALNGSDEGLSIAAGTVTQLQNLYGITVSGNGSHAITLTASAGLDPTFFQLALRTIQYANTSTNPGDTARHVLVETVDMAGHPGPSATTTVNITPVNAVSVVGPISAPAGVTELADASAQAISLSGSVSVTDGDIGETVALVVDGTPTAVWSGGASLPASVDVAALLDPAALTLGSVTATGQAQTAAWSYDATADLDWLADGETLTLTFDVAADDGNGTSAAQQLVITITGTNDGPAAVTLSATEIAENSGNGAARIVATLGADDPDASDSGHTFALLGGDDGFYFELVNGNQLKFRDGVTLDAEGKSTYTVNLSTTDSDGETVTTQHQITIGDVNEFAVTTPTFDVTPVVAGLRANLLPVDTADGTFIGIRAVASDADAGDEVMTYELVGSLAGGSYTGGIFRIEATGPDAGKIMLADGSLLTDGTAYDLFVRAVSTDGSSRISSIRVQTGPSLLVMEDTLLNAQEAATAAFSVVGLAAGSSAVVTLSNGGASVTVPVNADGRYTVDLRGLGNGPVTVSVEVTDANGASSGSLAAGTVVLDQIAPVGAPTLGAAATDAAGVMQTVMLSGIEAGGSWEVSRDGGATWQAGSGAAMQVNTGSAATLTVRQVDAAGNRGADLATALSGSQGADSMAGGADRDMMFGWDGNDTLDGRGGADTMAGGLGDDTYIVNHVGDMVIERAGSGTDTIRTSLSTYSLVGLVTVENLMGAGTSGQVLSGNRLSNTIAAGTGDDDLRGGDGDDTLLGGIGNDTILGSTGNDSLNGSVGEDSLVGGIGDDLLMGGAGNDRLVGGDGNDNLNGGAGNDMLMGNAGADRFVFSAGFGQDTVSGFVAGDAGEADLLVISRAIASDFASLMALTADVGSRTVITIDSANSISLLGVAKADLVEGDFLFF